MKGLRGRAFLLDDDVQVAVVQWFRQQPRDFLQMDMLTSASVGLLSKCL